MTSKTKKTNARAEADAAIEVWKAAVAARTAASDHARTINEARRGVKAPTPTELTGDGGRLRVLEAEIALLEADDASGLAEAHAGALLDAVEVESGDGLAAGASLLVFRDDLAALLDVEARLVRELAENRRAIVARRSAAHAAHGQLCARRERNGEPRPAAHIDFTSATLDGLAEKIARIGKPTKDNAERIAAVRREEVALRAALERNAREARARAASARERGVAIEAEQRALRDGNEARSRNVVAQHDAARADDEALASAHRSREAGPVVAEETAQ